MKNLLNTILYITVIATIIYFGIRDIKSRITNNRIALEISELDIIRDYNHNLINAENNSRQMENFLNKNRMKIVLEKLDKSTILLSDIITNDSSNLCFSISENSCPACLDIEFKHIKHVSDSLKIAINIIFISQDWRFMKLIQKDYNFENKFYRLKNDQSFNENLMLFPFYFMIDNAGINFTFIPLKEQNDRTLKYFKFIKGMTNT